MGRDGTFRDGVTVRSCDGAPKPRAFFALTRKRYSWSGEKARYWGGCRPGATPCRTVSTWIDVRFDAAAQAETHSACTNSACTSKAVAPAWRPPQKVKVYT